MLLRFFVGDLGISSDVCICSLYIFHAMKLGFCKVAFVRMDGLMGKVSDKVKMAGMRKYARQSVLLKAQLSTGSYEFECVAYDLSLTGIMLKLDLPLATDCEVQIMVKDNPKISARVVWAVEGFIGLEFKITPEEVSSLLGPIGEKLPRA